MNGIRMLFFAKHLAPLVFNIMHKQFNRSFGNFLLYTRTIDRIRFPNDYKFIISRCRLKKKTEIFLFITCIEFIIKIVGSVGSR